VSIVEGVVDRIPWVCPEPDCDSIYLDDGETPTDIEPTCRRQTCDNYCGSLVLRSELEQEAP
jgi:hypothetical protein